MAALFFEIVVFETTSPTEYHYGFLMGCSGEKQVSEHTSDTSRRPDSSRAILLGGLAAGVVIVVAVLYVLASGAKNQTSTSNTGAAIIQGTPYDGSTVVEPPRDLRDFTLTTATGDSLSLSDLRGRVVLLYFGYTNCPDFCPQTLQSFKRVRILLGDQAGDVAFVFVSVDPRRDAPAVIERYLAQQGVGDFVIGMAGDGETIQTIAPDYGLYVELPADAAIQTNYTVDHSTSSYLINRNGQLVMMFDFGTEPDVIADNIRQALAA